MRLADPVTPAWQAKLGLDFSRPDGKTLLVQRQDGPLVVQKPFYPEGAEVCHAIVVHPPGGIAGGDRLELDVRTAPGAHALLTTPGAAKWYRTRGAAATQELRFAVSGVLEWLPRETIVFNGALCALHSEINLVGEGRFIGWEVLCLGRTGSGETFHRGAIALETSVRRDGKSLWLERGRIEGGGRLMSSPAGLAGRSVCATLVAIAPDLPDLRKEAPSCLAVTMLPGMLLARYLGDSSEEATRAFTALWKLVRPAVCGRAAVEPRIWAT